MRTIVIVQARMGSSRYPGKVLLPLGGKPVVSHVLARASAIAEADRVCLATTLRAEDDCLAEWALEAGVELYRGSEHDVLDRYHKASIQMGADAVMRITCDCPFIDPALCDKLLVERRAGSFDYMRLGHTEGWPHGLDCEVFLQPLLSQAAVQATDQYDREHVTPWIQRCGAKKAGSVTGPGGHFQNQRWTLDYPEDYTVIKSIYEKLPPDSERIIGWSEIMDIVEQNPGIAEANIRRKVRKNESR